MRTTPLSALAPRGDRRAFSELVSRHESRLRAFLRRLAGPELGDDLAQEAFLRAWQSAWQFRSQARYPSWLCAIGWRCFADHARREKREARRRDESWILQEESDESSPEAAIDLETVLQRLSAAERAALILCDGHGMSHGEAAEVLAIPLGTLKAAVMRAKRKCREMLGVDS